MSDVSRLQRQQCRRHCAALGKETGIPDLADVFMGQDLQHSRNGTSSGAIDTRKLSQGDGTRHQTGVHGLRNADVRRIARLSRDLRSRVGARHGLAHV